MSETITVGLDQAKNVFQAHGADAYGRSVLRRKLRRDQVLAFFGQLPPCVLTMEACGGAKAFRQAPEERCGRRGGDLRGSAETDA